MSPAATALRNAPSHSFSAKDCQTSSTMRPSGFSARARLANAATGSPKNITPVRLITRS